MKKEKRAIPEMSIDAKMLYDRLVKMEIGEEVSYGDLSRIIGRNVQSIAYSLLKTAREKAEREEQMVFAPVRNIGIKRLNDIGIISAGSGYIGKIRRLARRGSRKITCVKDFSSLPKDEQLKHNVSLSVLGAMEQFGSSATIRRISGKVASTQGILPSAIAARAAFE